MEQLYLQGNSGSRINCELVQHKVWLGGKYSKVALMNQGSDVNYVTQVKVLLFLLFRLLCGITLMSVILSYGAADFFEMDVR